MSTKRKRSLSPCPSHASSDTYVSPTHSPSSSSPAYNAPTSPPWPYSPPSHSSPYSYSPTSSQVSHPYSPVSPAYSSSPGAGVSRAEVTATQVLHSNEIRRMEEAHKGEIARLNAEHEAALRAAEEKVRAEDGAALEAAECRARKEQSRKDKALGEVDRLRRRADRDHDAKKELRHEVDRLKADYKTARTTLSQRKVKKYERTIDEQRADIGRLEKKVKQTAALKAHNAKLKADIDKERQGALAEKEKCAQLRSQLDAATTHFDEHRAHMAAQTAALKTQNAALKGDIDEERQVAQAEKDTLQADINKARGENATLRRQFNNEMIANEQLQLEVERLVEQGNTRLPAVPAAAQSNEQVEKYEKTVSEQRADIEQLNGKVRELVALRTHSESLKNDVDKERQVARAEKDKCAQMQSQIALLLDEHKSHVAAFGIYELARAAAEGERDKLQAELDRLKGEMQGMAAALAELEKAGKHSNEAKQHSTSIAEECPASVPRPSDRRRVCGDKLRSALGVLASGGERHSVEFVRMAALAVIKHSKAH